MNAIERHKRTKERHRAFLENVTGRPFEQPRLDFYRHGVLFPSFGFVSNGDVTGFIHIESLITDVKDFAS